MQLIFLAVKPRIIEHTENLILRQGESKIITCTASGNPDPSVIWRKPDGTNISFSDINISKSGTNITATYQLRKVSIKKLEQICRKQVLFPNLTLCIYDYVALQLE